MEKIIEFRHTNFSYNGSNAFNDFNMYVDAKDIVSIVGPMGSGKTTLLKMLCHKLPNDSCYFKGKPFSEYSSDELKRQIVVILDLPFTANKVQQELLSKIEQLSVDSSEKLDKFNDIVDFFGLKDVLSLDIDRLSFGKQNLIKILRYLIIHPKVVAIDNLLVNLSKEDKNRVIDYIKKYEMTLINVTNDLSETLYGNRIFVLENFVMIMEGNTLTVLQADTLLKRLGFKLPLAVGLSIELGNYGLIKKVYTTNEKLVKALWK